MGGCLSSCEYSGTAGRGVLQPDEVLYLGSGAWPFLLCDPGLHPDGITGPFVLTSD